MLARAPGTRTRARVKTCSWCATICLRRPAPDRVGVDPRDDARDQDDPGQLLEVAEEPPAEARRRAEPREVREHVGVGVRSARPRARRTRARPAAATRYVAQRQRQQHEARTSPASATSAIHATSHQTPVAPELGRDLVVGEERRDRARALVGRQCGPPGPDRLEGVPKGGLRGRLVERGVDVGDGERLDRRREALELAERALDAAARAGSRCRSGTRARRSPITTTSFGSTMRSSRCSQSAATCRGRSRRT